MCNCPIPCGFDHCCMSERYRAYEQMQPEDRPQYWTSIRCPKPHPPALIQLARGGDREAARQAVELFAGSGQATWCGIMRAETIELARGDYAAVERRRREEERVKAIYDRKRPRWSVNLHIVLAVGSTLGTHKEFATERAARRWAERFPDNREVLRKYFAELNRGQSASSWGSEYRLGPETEVSVIRIDRQRLAYPWFGENVWHPDKTVWRWESTAYRALVASHGKAV